MKKVFMLVFVFVALSVGSIYAYNGSNHSQGEHNSYRSGYDNDDRRHNNRGRNHNDRGSHNNRGNHNRGCGYNY